MMQHAFDLKDITKHFGAVKALNGVTLHSDEGKVFALLGPNGAGKTTIVRILSTLLEPSSGSALVHGLDVVKKPKEVREIIGLAGQYAAVDEFQTGFENIYMVGLLYGLKRADARKRSHELIERLGLSKAADRQVKTYSGGMRRRLDLGASLVGQPKILFLDEPTTGLDPGSRQSIWQIVHELIDQGTSILLTTQYLEEADELADTIAVVDEGKVIAEGTSDQLKSRLGGDTIEFQLESIKDLSSAEEVVKSVAKSSPDFNQDTLVMRIPVHNGSKDLMVLVEKLNQAKLNVDALSLHRPSLDDVFLALTGNRTQSQESEQPKNKKRMKR